MPYVGRTMDRKANKRRRDYLARTFCEEHRRIIGLCRPGDPACMVCGCGGLCDSKHRCAMAKRPEYRP